MSEFTWRDHDDLHEEMIEMLAQRIAELEIERACAKASDASWSRAVQDFEDQVHQLKDQLAKAEQTA